MVKVSVIIPVYNTAEYLRNSIGSVLSQTLTDLEIIAVNNGSTDGSENILKELAADDERIKFYDMPPLGLSAARNEGMKHISGEYIYFMDSDDYISNDTFELCVGECERKHLNFITFDADKDISEDHNSTVQDYDRRYTNMDGKVWRGADLLDYQIAHGAYRSPVWLMFCRKDFLLTCFNGFSEGYIHEDHKFTVTAYIKAERAEYLPSSLYHRIVRPDSIMTRRFSMRNVYGYRQAVKDVCGIKGNKATIRKWRQMTVNAVVWQCHTLPFIDKIKTIFIFIVPNIRYITFRNICVFLLK